MSVTFDAYAKYYDLLNSEKDYATEARYVARLIRRHSPHAASLLEFGCGTGGHGALLVEDGFSVTGLDSSEAMLAEAERRKDALPAETARKLTLLRGDARTVALETRFDVVAALFHVMSYQTEDEDVSSLIDAAARHLEPGGLFIFDFWHGPAVLSQQPEVRVKRRVGEGVAVERLAEPTLVLAENRVTVTYTIRVDADSRARPAEFSERHDMRYLFLPELRMFARERFEVVETLAWLSEREPGFGDWSAVGVWRRR